MILGFLQYAMSLYYLSGALYSLFGASYKCVLNVNTGPNPTPMSKLGKQNEKNPKIEICQKWCNYEGGRPEIALPIPL